MVCKYHQNPELDPKILPKRPQVATNRCFIKLDNSSAFIGVSEHHFDLTLESSYHGSYNLIFDITGAWYHMGYTLQQPNGLL